MPLFTDFGELSENYLRKTLLHRDSGTCNGVTGLAFCMPFIVGFHSLLGCLEKWKLRKNSKKSSSSSASSVSSSVG